MSEVAVRDVIPFERSVWGVERQAHPPIEDRVDLGDGIYIEHLPNHLNQKLQDAWAPRGYHWDLHTHTIPVLYAFVRDTVESADWDGDMKLQVAVALSRFCHPTSIGLEYAATVFGPGVRHQDYQIRPAMIVGHGNQAFIPDPNGRNWLTPADVADLPAMIAAFATIPARVQRAVWFHEYAARTEQVPVRLTLVATGIEALVHIERHRSTQQFAVGAVGLAADCDLTYTDAQARNAYDRRSRYAHGVSVSGSPNAVLIDLEAVLRAAIRKTLLDPHYAAIFADDAETRQRFQLPIHGSAIS